MTIVNEQIVTGRKFRKLIDEASRLWMRVSFWTKACDVEFDDGETAETKFANLKNTIDNLKKSFQDGVNKIYNYLKGLGFTPNPNSPDGICSAIQDMYNKRYADGIAQGQKNVIDDPESYGVSTGFKASDMLSCGWRADFGGGHAVYSVQKTGFVSIWFQWSVTYQGPHGANGGTIILRKNGVDHTAFNLSDLGHNVSDYDSGRLVIEESTEWNFEGLNCNAGDQLDFAVNTNNANCSMVIAVANSVRTSITNGY